ncbi:MAG TPA: rod shape-determining protein MreD [Termitinemataceae bacterium]|nr:rod shape-determining protein MreD [Termitinemataceae bacterium]HOM22372.1 rod shape-determining protein MreD [Termitinemataceae bacterium]HPP99628.1 rod shape-determining protein MreD [Termitinemataceae bacterium]
MIKPIIWSTVFTFIAAILQSTILSKFTFISVIPDLTLIILVYIAFSNGTMVGQISGFTSGLILDFFTAAPLGYNMLVRTIVGFLVGLLNGSVYLDIFIFPILLTGITTVIKAVIVFILHILFSGMLPFYQITEPIFWIELLMNMGLAPFVFSFLKLFKKILLVPRNVL